LFSKNLLKIKPGLSICAVNGTPKFGNRFESGAEAFISDGNLHRPFR